MKYVFKILSFIGLILTSVIFGIIYLGQQSIPDEIHIVESQNINANAIFSLGVKDINAITAEKTFSKNGDDRDGTTNYTLNFSLLEAIPVKSSNVTVSKRQYVIAGGDVFGIKLYTDGVIIVGTDDVFDGVTTVNPAKQAGLEAGDVITAVDSKRVTKVSEVTNSFKNAQKSTVRLSVSRNGMPFETEINLVRNQNGEGYKAGLWIRDSTAGVGTVTYYIAHNGIFAGLGHAVCDADTGVVMPMLEGEAVKAAINGCYKGTSSYPGELCGVFTTKNLGKLFVNCENGVYGVLDSMPDGVQIPVATAQEVQTGEAQIISTVDGGGPEYYDIRIVRLSPFESKNDKNMVIEVTDPDLIEKTGGIVQGMSGSPIIQNGMLVGAVTHVFVNNPTQGYAIFAETMLEESLALEKELLTDKAA